MCLINMIKPEFPFFDKAVFTKFEFGLIINRIT